MSVFATKVVNFSTTTLIPLEDEDDNPIFGGILSDANHCWLRKNSNLEIRNLKTGRNIATWTFGHVLRDPNTKILCLDEILDSDNQLGLLVVAVECSFGGGMICFFDVFGSRVVRAIQVNYKIASIHVCDSALKRVNLPGIFKHFDGILSVGTEGGDVYLIDICRNTLEDIYKDERCPSQLILLTPEDIIDLSSCKLASRRTGDHIAVHLNIILDKSSEHFTLKGPKNEDIIHVNKEEVKVSSLHYSPQLTSLLIGFNFGAYQLWNLTDLNLIYTSPVCEDHLPITHFTIQEPVDDPKAYCYIWVSYSPQELYQTGLPFVVMYTVYYETKRMVENYGSLYENFQYCSIRLQIDLSEAISDRKRVRGGRCLGFQSITRMIKHKHMMSDENLNDTLVLCLIGCTLWFKMDEIQTFFLLFDLNQWYKEQMPSTPCWRDNFLLKINLSEIDSANTFNETVHNVRIIESSLRQFVGVQKLEEHYFPTSLTFDCLCLQTNNISSLRIKSVQKSFLDKVVYEGPLCLLQPVELCEKVLNYGLMPLFFDYPSNIHNLSIEHQRELLLNVALEQKLTNFLYQCAADWANGSYLSSGCSIEFLMNWSFERTITIKNHSDEYCKQLFDYSEVNLDNNSSRLLNNCIRQLKNLNSFYTYVLKKFMHFLPIPEVIEEQSRCLRNTCNYFDVLQWFVNVGLLPECDPSHNINVPYQVEKLVQYYNEKRANLRMLSDSSYPHDESLLFIDNFIGQKCVEGTLQQQWQEDGGSGLYPPTSFQSILRTYLIDGPNIENKHLLVTYFFLDLTKLLDSNQHQHLLTNLIKFPTVFNVRPSMMKLIQAFWQLDHGDYTNALEELLNPMILNSDFEQWHHSIVLRALLLQNQQKFALLYMQVRKPAINDENDILTAISLFIANNMLDEAFYFQKQYQNDKLLIHFFNECNKHKAIRDLLYKNLSANEERVFFNYLKCSNDPEVNDLQVFYYLLRSKFIEAFDVHEHLKNKRFEKQILQNTGSTDQIVRIYKSLLPDINRTIVNVVRKERVNLFQKNVVHPKPLSVSVKSGNAQVQYKSSLFNTLLTESKRNLGNKMDVTTDDLPFLRAPIINQSQNKNKPVMITPRIIVDDDYVTPSKRLRLTPRQPISSCRSVNNTPLVNEMMNTPIVKRQTPSIQSANNTFTPQHSILKGRKIMDEMNMLTPSRYSLKGNTSLRNTSRLSVRFDESTRSTSTISNKSQFNDLSENKMEETNSNNGSDNVFYSPNESFNDEASCKNESLEVRLESVQSPKGRRSYKRSLADVIPSRSSPRLSQVYVNSPKTRPVLQARKSLSRQAVENAAVNASNSFSSLPEMKVVSKEISIERSEKTVVKKGNETITEESEHKTVDKESENQKHHSESHSTRKSVSRLSVSITTDDSMYSWGDLTLPSSPYVSPDVSMSFIKNLNKKESVDIREENNEVKTSEEPQTKHDKTGETEDKVLLRDTSVRQASKEKDAYEESNTSTSDDLETIANKEVEKQSEHVFCELYNDLSDEVNTEENVFDMREYNEQNDEEDEENKNDVIEIGSSTDEENVDEQSSEESDLSNEKSTEEESESEEDSNNDLNDALVYNEEEYETENSNEANKVEKYEEECDMEALVFDEFERDSSNSNISVPNKEEHHLIERNLPGIEEENSNLTEENPQDINIQEENENLVIEEDNDAPEKRITRRTSQLSTPEKENVLSSIESEQVDSQKENKQDTATPLRRSIRRMSQLEQVKESQEEKPSTSRTPTRRMSRTASQSSNNEEDLPSADQQSRRITRRLSQVSAIDDSVPELEKTSTTRARRTRQNSVDLLKSTAEVRKPRKTRSASVDNVNDMVMYKNIIFDEDEFPGTPEIRKVGSSSKIKTYGKTNFNLRNKQSESKVDELDDKVFDDDVLPRTPALRRKVRSASVDEIKMYKPKRNVRNTKNSNSTESPVLVREQDDNVKTYGRKGREKSKERVLPAIMEEDRGYAESRRLTRSQVSMLKENESKIKRQPIPIVEQKESLSPKASGSRSRRAESVASDISTSTRRSKRSVESSSVVTRSKSRNSEGDEESPKKKTKTSRSRTNSESSSRSDVTDTVRRSTRSNSKLREVPEENQSSRRTRGKK